VFAVFAVFPKNMASCHFFFATAGRWREHRILRRSQMVAPEAVFAVFPKNMASCHFFFATAGRWREHRILRRSQMVAPGAVFAVFPRKRLLSRIYG